MVADLTADTFVGVITHFGSFDPRKGTARAWVFGIARRVYATYCEAYSQQQHKMRRLAGRRELDQDQVEELLDRIDAERAGRDLVSELAALPERDRAVVELVDIAGLRPKEAATVSSGSTDRRWQTPDGRRRDPGPGAHRSTRCRRPPCDRGTRARSP